MIREETTMDHRIAIVTDTNSGISQEQAEAQDI